MYMQVSPRENSTEHPSVNSFTIYYYYSTHTAHRGNRVMWHRLQECAIIIYGIPYQPLSLPSEAVHRTTNADSRIQVIVEGITAALQSRDNGLLRAIISSRKHAVVRLRNYLPFLKRTLFV